MGTFSGKHELTTGQPCETHFVPWGSLRAIRTERRHNVSSIVVIFCKLSRSDFESNTASSRSRASNDHFEVARAFLASLSFCAALSAIPGVQKLHEMSLSPPSLELLPSTRSRSRSADQCTFVDRCPRACRACLWLARRHFRFLVDADSLRQNRNRAPRSRGFGPDGYRSFWAEVGPHAS